MGASASKGLIIRDKERRAENMDNSQEFQSQLLAYHRSLSAPVESNSRSVTTAGEDDVVFHVGIETVMRISAKKSVLARKNEVFYAMFYGAYSQANQEQQHLRHRINSESALDPSMKNKNSTSVVEQIFEPDVDGRAFKNLISFLNGETVELRSVVTAAETLHAAEKYLCDGLMKICVNYLASQLSADNVLQIYRRARFYAPAPVVIKDFMTYQQKPSAPSLDQINNGTPVESSSPAPSLPAQSRTSCWCSFLMNSCLEFIDKNASAVLTSEEFEELDAESVELIVSRDDLRLRNESEILTALVRWSVFECHRRQLDPSVENQRHVLNNLIWNVRFLTMPAKEMWETPIISQLLDEKESSALLACRQQQISAELLPEHIRSHLPRIAQSRKYLSQSVLGRNSDSEPLPPSCRKSCITEKIFVGLACIFE